MTLPNCQFKPDLAATMRRFDAWWGNDMADRAPVSITIKPTRAYDGPIPAEYGSIEQAWFDNERIVDTAIAVMAQHDWLGDGLPVFCANMGPDITATPLGCELEFSRDSSWAVPTIHAPGGWSDLLDQPMDFGNRYWANVEALERLAIEKNSGRYLVGMTDLHGAYDILAALRDPQMLCLDLVDCPELVDAAGQRMAEVFNAAFDRQWALVNEAGMPATCWTPLLHQGPAYVNSCDFWCLVGDDLVRELILPTVVAEMQPMERSLFHLDGPQALRHLNLLLELPELDAVQWVYGAGQEPAAKWIDVYKRCQSAGKAVQVLAVDAHDALAVYEQLDPKGVWLHIDKPLPDAASAKALLDDVTRLSMR